MENNLMPWHKCNCIGGRAKALLKSEHWSDCIFQVGPQRTEIKCHKLIVAMASPVLAASIYGVWRNNPKIVTDFDDVIFKALITYIYSDELDIKTVEEAFTLYQAGSKYMLPFLTKKCCKYICGNMDYTHACQAYEFGVLFEDFYMTDRALEQIMLYAPKIFKHPSFYKLKRSSLVTIFSLEKLNIKNEMDLFEAARFYIIGNKGSPDESDSSGMTLTDALKKIRFLTMSAKQFAEGPGRHHTILSTQVSLGILSKITSPNNVNISMPEGFTTCNKLRKKFVIRKDSVDPFKDF